ncbi:MAG TPA: transposase [Chloroflexota bacterium]|nr:transposase [Chloroflexota bacterium]
MSLLHVNFHTLGRRPVFIQEEYDAAMRGLLTDVLDRCRIYCPAWEVMPTHVHLIVQDFDDYPRDRVMQQIKGATAYGFFKQYPSLREDLLGGHLWAKGYFWVEIVSYRQYVATADYIRANRHNAGLEPPVPLSLQASSS